LLRQNEEELTLLFLLPAWKREGEGREGKGKGKGKGNVSKNHMDKREARKVKSVKIKKVDLRLHHDAVASAPVFSGMHNNTPSLFRPVIVA